MCELAARELGISPAGVVVASTGVIGLPLPIEPIERSIGPLAAALSSEGSAQAAAAIMTTDTKPKEVAAAFSVEGVPCTLGGIAKGSGMIHPNMATMLIFLTTDAAIAPALLQKAGAAFDADRALTLTLSEDGKTASRTVGLVQPEPAGDMPAIAARKIGGVYYVDFNQCVDDGDFQRERAALAEAVRGGTRQVILDIRGNGGGDSYTCVQLLDALGMAPPDYGAYVRYSPLAQQTYPQFYAQSEGGERFAPDLSAARANPKVELAVLTDEDTFSSATMLAVYVRDGGLGTIIGRPSANRPSHYGDLLGLVLDNTGLGVRISHKQWLRPDQTDPSDTLTPDIETVFGEDALARALEVLGQPHNE